MEIGPVDNWGRPSGPEDDKQRNNQPVTEGESKKSEPGKDSVEISPTGRRLAEEAGQAPQPSDVDSAGATEESKTEAEVEEVEQTDVRKQKIEQARQRIESGYYDQPEVKKEIARRITDDLAG